MSKNVLMMAFAKGQVSTESTSEIKRYIGIGVVKVLCINPTSKQIKEFMGYEPKEEPVYFGVQDTPDGKKLPYFRVTFIIKTTPEKSNGIDTTQMLTYYVRKQYVQSQSGKYQVTDAYGNTAWGTKEEITAKSEIKYANGPAQLLGEYKPLYVGERALMRFVQEFLVIGSYKNTSGYDYINDTWIPMAADKLKDCECTFSNDELEKMFKGDFTPIENYLAYQSNNEVKVLFGIRTTDDGKEYQDIYTRPLRLRVTNWDIIQQEIDESKERGGLKNRTYEFCKLKEYKPVATDFNAESIPSDDPFGSAPANTPW